VPASSKFSKETPAKSPDQLKRDTADLEGAGSEHRGDQAVKDEAGGGDNGGDRDEGAGLDLKLDDDLAEIEEAQRRGGEDSDVEGDRKDDGRGDEGDHLHLARSRCRVYN
jgi:hypothetical protein